MFFNMMGDYAIKRRSPWRNTFPNFWDWHIATHDTGYRDSREKPDTLWINGAEYRRVIPPEVVREYRTVNADGSVTQTTEYADDSVKEETVLEALETNSADSAEE